MSVSTRGDPTYWESEEYTGGAVGENTSAVHDDDEKKEVCLLYVVFSWNIFPMS
jgi:hypothetical protein